MCQMNRGTKEPIFVGFQEQMIKFLPEVSYETMHFNEMQSKCSSKGRVTRVLRGGWRVIASNKDAR
jgi:hypothetical protein